MNGDNTYTTYFYFREIPASDYKKETVHSDGRIGISVADQNNPYYVATIRGKVVEQTKEGFLRYPNVHYYSDERNQIYFL